MLADIPNKTKCKFNGCDFKRSDAEAVKKHEDECENRNVPCAFCDEKISLRGLAEHVVEKHTNGKEFKVGSFGEAKHILSLLSRKAQVALSVTGNDCQKFLFNWCSLDNNSMLFWVVYIGQKHLASKYMYTLQVERSKEETKTRKYVFEGTRECIPCDLSHKDVKKNKWALLLDKDLLADAPKEDGRTRYTLTIYKS